jgi:hypothetical protein
MAIIQTRNRCDEANNGGFVLLFKITGGSCCAALD